MRRVGRWDRRARRGVALLEVVVSATSGAILFAGMATAVMLSLRAGDATIGPWSRTRIGADAGFQLTRELQHAKSFNSSYSTANRVEFTIPDQTGDGIDETVRYEWSGTAGHPVYRTFNGGTAEEFLPNIHAFTLQYRTKAIPPEPTYTEAAEAQYLDLNSSNTGFLADWQGVSRDTWVAQHFTPNLPSNAVSWRVTRVQLYLAPTGSENGLALVQVRRAGPNQAPSASFVCQAVLSESEFPSNWFTATFANAAGLLPTEGVCIVLGSGNGVSETVANVRLGLLSLGTTSTTMLYSYDGGSTWGAANWNDLWLRVWGRVTTKTPGTGPTRYFRTGVDVTVQVGASSAASSTMAVQTVNQPEVTGP